MGDLQNPVLIVIKGVLFSVTALLAAGLLLLESPTLRTAALLSVCIWASCRFYYFLFDVMRRYVDPQFRFRGITDFVWYCLRRRTASQR